MNLFRFKGTVQIEHLNARKTGPEDSKTLALDIKLSARVTQDVFHFFQDQLPYALWLPGGAVRCPVMGPIPFDMELEDYRIDALSKTHFGAKVKKFSLKAIDGFEVDLVFSVSFDPQGTDVAVLAEHLQETMEITVQPTNQDLLIEDDGIWCTNPLVDRVPKDGANDGDGSEPGDSDLFSQVSSDGDDALLEQARTLVLTHQKASISFIQRHLRIGYNRAASLLEALEAYGMVSAMGADGQRTILAHEGVEP